VALDNVENVIQFVQLFDHDYDFLPDFSAGEGELDELLILEAVEYEQAVARLFERERSVEFGFRAGLEAEVVA